MGTPPYGDVGEDSCHIFLLSELFFVLLHLLREDSSQFVVSCGGLLHMMCIEHSCLYHWSFFFGEGLSFVFRRTPQIIFMNLIYIHVMLLIDWNTAQLRCFHWLKSWQNIENDRYIDTFDIFTFTQAIGDCFICMTNQMVIVLL